MTIKNTKKYGGIVGVTSLRILDVTPQPASMHVGRLWGDIQNPQ